METELSSGKNVLVFCYNGRSKSAAVVIYYLLKRGETLQSAVTELKRARETVNIPPDLVRYLIDEEVRQKGKTSIALGGRGNREILYLSSSSISTNIGYTVYTIMSIIVIFIAIGFYINSSIL